MLDCNYFATQLNLSNGNLIAVDDPVARIKTNQLFPDKVHNLHQPKQAERGVTELWVSQER